MRRFGHRIHAYCWMANHVHLAVEVDEMPLSFIIHNLCSRYANWFNRRYSRTGHLFERRYRAGLVETGESACRLIRYIHLNPVRAGVVGDPRLYPWSSHASYVGKSRVPWLETRWILRLFGDSGEASRKSLETYVLEGIEDLDDTGGPQELAELLEDCEGSAEQDEGTTLSRHQRFSGPPLWQLATIQEILEVVCALERVELGELRSRGQKRPISRSRAVASFIVRQCQSPTTAELSRAVGRDRSAMSRAADRVARNLASDQGLAKRVQKTQDKLRETVRRRL